MAQLLVYNRLNCGLTQLRPYSIAGLEGLLGHQLRKLKRHSIAASEGLLGHQLYKLKLTILN